MTHLLLAGVFDPRGREVVDRPESGEGVDGFSSCEIYSLGPSLQISSAVDTSGMLGASLTAYLVWKDERIRLLYSSYTKVSRNSCCMYNTCLFPIPLLALYSISVSF
jgi:hypothetical protein